MIPCSIPTSTTICASSDLEKMHADNYNYRRIARGAGQHYPGEISYTLSTDSPSLKSGGLLLFITQLLIVDRHPDQSGISLKRRESARITEMETSERSRRMAVKASP